MDDQDFPALHPTDVPQQNNPKPKLTQPSTAKSHTTTPAIDYQQELNKKVDNLKQLLQTQMATQMDALTTKFETHINNTIETKMSQFETQVNNTLDDKLDNFLLKLQTLIPLQPPAPQNITPAPTPQTHTNPTSDSQEFMDTSPPTTPGEDPLMTQEIIAVGTDKSSDGVLI